MNTLYGINALIYSICCLSIILAVARMPKEYRWIHIVSLVICIYYSGVYFFAWVEVLPDENIAFFTRPVSGVWPIQVATLAWLFGSLLQKWRILGKGD